MTKQPSLKAIINSVSNEKNLSKNIIFDAIKSVILYATKKKYKLLNIDICINEYDYSYKTYTIHNVVKKLNHNISIKDSFKKIPIDRAKKYKTNIKINGIIRKEIKSINFYKIDSSITKQIIAQKVKYAEQNMLLDEFKNKVGKIFFGIVIKITERKIIIDLGDNAEGVLEKRHLIPKDDFDIGDKVKACFLGIFNGKYTSELRFSRFCNQMLIELLKVEVPEINENTIEIKDVVREPGIRSKVSVISKNKKIDPIGTCIGLHGSRAQNVSKQLCGEKIDLILWNENLMLYVINILSPIKIKLVKVDSEINRINVIVAREDLPKVIGKHGLNIKLINRLVNHTTIVMTQ